MASRITTDDGIELHVVLSGNPDGPTLMFCNSLGTDHRMWDGEAAVFGTDYRIVRYDRRGHGQSDAPAGPYSFERLGRDVLCILDALKIDKTWFCGLSMGGMTGMWLAANAPERFHGLILANTAAHMPPLEMWAERIDMSRSGHLDQMAPKVMERWFTESFRQEQPQDVAKVVEQYLATPAEGYAACCEAIRDMDHRDLIKTIRARVHVIGGSADPATTPAHCRYVAQNIAEARYSELKDAAHLSNIEKSAEFQAIMRSFMATSAQ